MDQGRNSTPDTRVLLRNVESLDWQFIDSDNKFYDFWPPTNEWARHLPSAIEVSIHIAGLGDLTRLFVIKDKYITIEPETDSDGERPYFEYQESKDEVREIEIWQKAKKKAEEYARLYEQETG